MRKHPLLSPLLLCCLGLAIGPALSAESTAVLDVPGMTCSMCPIAVKKSLQRVAGVIRAKVTFGNKEAVVTFDDSKTSVEELRQATANAGYPSTVKTQ